LKQARPDLAGSAALSGKSARVIPTGACDRRPARDDTKTLIAAFPCQKNRPARRAKRRPSRHGGFRAVGKKAVTALRIDRVNAVKCGE
jgi:hypothetical protein